MTTVDRPVQNPYLVGNFAPVTDERDASDFTAPPAATVHLPRRVPVGFHGSWIPGVSLG